MHGPLSASTYSLWHSYDLNATRLLWLPYRSNSVAQMCGRGLAGLSRQGLMRMASAEERAPAFAPPRRPRAAPIPDHVTLDVGRGHVFAEDQRQRVGGVLQVGFRAVKLLKVLVVLSNVS